MSTRDTWHFHNGFVQIGCATEGGGEKSGGYSEMGAG